MELLKQKGGRHEKEVLLPIYNDNLQKMKKGLPPPKFKRPVDDIPAF
jgi:hypothetical protein